MKQIESKSRLLDDVGEVTVTLFGARDALKLTRRLGQPIMAALGAAKDAKLDVELATVADVAGPLSTLFSALDDDELDALLLAMLRGTAVNTGTALVTLDSKLKIDSVFGADFVALVRVCAFVVEANYGDFLGLLRAVLGRVQQKQAAAAAAKASPKSD